MPLTALPVGEENLNTNEKAKKLELNHRFEDGFKPLKHRLNDWFVFIEQKFIQRQSLPIVNGVGEESWETPRGMPLLPKTCAKQQSFFAPHSEPYEILPRCFALHVVAILCLRPLKYRRKSLTVYDSVPESLSERIDDTVQFDGCCHEYLWIADNHLVPFYLPEGY